MVITIRVTQEHIKHGIRGDCTNCPVALALMDALDVLWVRVGGIIRLVTRDVIHDLIPPDSVTRFMTHFDNRGSVEPFSFKLEVPDDCIRKHNTRTY